MQVRLTNTREIAIISDDVRFQYECNRNAFRRCVPVKVERKWNANGTRLERARMEREWNANGTQMERKWNAFRNAFRTRSGRVPNAFSVRLFLSSTVRMLQPNACFRCCSLIALFKSFLQQFITFSRLRQFLRVLLDFFFFIVT